MHRTTGADYCASIRTQAAIEKAEVALVLIDGAAPLTEQDVRVIQQVIDAGRALVVVTNSGTSLMRIARRRLRASLSASSCRCSGRPHQPCREDRVAHEPYRASTRHRARGLETRIPTGQLNAFLGQLVAAHPHPLRGGKQPAFSSARKPPAAPSFRSLHDRFPRSGLSPFSSNGACVRPSVLQGLPSKSPFASARRRK